MQLSTTAIAEWNGQITLKTNNDISVMEIHIDNFHLSNLPREIYVIQYNTKQMVHERCVLCIYKYFIMTRRCTYICNLTCRSSVGSRRYSCS